MNSTLLKSHLLNYFPFVCGLIFGFGLILSGMTDPLRIQAFLDVAGAWNPSMALVMGGAIAVALPTFTYVRLRGRNLVGATVVLPDRKTLTPRLIIGSAIFGLGWGLSGICPGPGILIAANGVLGGVLAPVAFLLSMIAGMLIYAAWSKRAPAASVPLSVQVNGL